MSSQPPPLPAKRDQAIPSPAVQSLEYRRMQLPDESRKVFDRVAGPNLRLKDNLVQLACAIVGAAAGGYLGSRLHVGNSVVLGMIGGLLLAVLASGLVIGLIRFLGAGRR